jgi:putative transposase
MTLTAKEIASLRKISVQAVHKMAAKNGWAFKTIFGRGKPTKEYLLSSLPDDIRLLYNKVALEKAQNLPVVYNGPTGDGRWVTGNGTGSGMVPAKQPPAVVTPAQKQTALTKYDLLRLYKERVNSAPYGRKEQARNDFIDTYNAGLLYPKLFEALGPVSWKTVEGWKLDVKRARNDCFVLADNRGAWKRGMTLIGPLHEKILLMCLLHPHAPKIAEAIRYAREIMHQRGIENGYSEATYRRWITEWRDRHYHIWVFTREGWKAWNDKCSLYADRDYDLIEVGDLAVADGHVLNFDIINPWTGKPKRMTLLLWIDMKSTYPLGWEIMPTENTQAIAAALRWAILRLGKFPKIAYIDNGKAFGSRFFNGTNLEDANFSGLFERLGMQVIHARPYRGQSKTIERFFGSFAELERWAPTHTGTSIATKPPGMNRGERLHRKVRAQMVGDGLTLEQAHYAVAEWFDRYVRRPQQEGHLKDRTPLEVFEAGKGPGVDRALLNDMMMTCEIKYVRRSVISMPGGHRYYHRALHGRKHKVLIHYDFQDLSHIRVSELTGELICVAEEYGKLHPAAGYLGTDADFKALADHCEEHHHQEKEAATVAAAFLKDQFLPAHREQMARIGVDTASQKPVIPGQTGTKDAKPVQIGISEEEWARIQAEAEQTEVEDLSEKTIDLAACVAQEDMEEDAVALRARLEAMPEDERYMAIMEMEVRGKLIPERWRDFARYFEDTLAYLNHVDFFEEKRGELAVAWQADAGQGAMGEGR